MKQPDRMKGNTSVGKQVRDTITTTHMSLQIALCSNKQDNNNKTHKVYAEKLV